jgi:hypothetical protein
MRSSQQVVKNRQVDDSDTDSDNVPIVVHLTT